MSSRVELAPLQRALPGVFFWLTPPVFLLLLYWPALGAWFQADDFAWLGLTRQVHDWPSLLHTLFAPMAHGNLRPWSERAFFLLLRQIFGVDAIAWRIVVFVTAAIDLALLGAIVARLARSWTAGWIAPLVWIVSASMPVALAWTSDYNQLLCPLFLLLAFYWRLRGLFWLEIVTFALGFGALEINVVYPAIVLAWVLLRREPTRKRDWFEIGFLFIISAVYVGVRSFVVPPITQGPYAMHFGPSMAITLEQYWRWALVDPAWLSIFQYPEPAILAAVAVFTVLIGMLVGAEHRVTLFGIAWFLITLAPLLTLRDHVSDYYLNIPMIGLAIAVGAGVASLRRVPARIAAYSFLAVFLALNAAGARASCDWWSARTKPVRVMVLGAMTAHEKNPGRDIVLTNVNDDLYDIGVAHAPFAALGVPDVYLAPDLATRLHPPSYLPPVSDFVLPPGPALRALADHRLAVYEIDSDHLRNVTSVYSMVAPSELEDRPPERVDVGDPLTDYLLGPEWYARDEHHRWMPHEATLTLGGPSASDHHLQVTAYCPPKFVRDGPLTLAVSIDNMPLPPAVIRRPESPVVRDFNIPAEIAGKKSVVVRLRVSRTHLVASDSRPLGLALGVVEFRP